MTHHERYEYRTIKGRQPIEVSQLGDQGLDGWVLCAAFWHPLLNECHYHFHRPINEDAADW